MEVHRYPREHCIMGISGSQPPSKTRARHFIHPKQFVASPRRIVLPYSYGEILSRCEEDVSSTRDGFTAWVKSENENILRRHIVDVTRARAASREAPARKHSPSCQGYHFNNDIPNRLTEQTRLNVYNWNPGPRHQDWRAGQGKRRRIWLGVARCHFKSIFLSATAQRPIILHGNASSHQQQVCQKAWNRDEASPHYPCHYAGRARGPGGR